MGRQPYCGIVDGVWRDVGDTRDVPGDGDGGLAGRRGRGVAGSPRGCISGIKKRAGPGAGRRGRGVTGSPIILIVGIKQRAGPSAGRRGRGVTGSPIIIIVGIKQRAGPSAGRRGRGVTGSPIIIIVGIKQRTRSCTTAPTAATHGLQQGPSPLAGQQGDGAGQAWGGAYPGKAVPSLPKQAGGRQRRVPLLDLQCAEAPVCSRRGAGRGQRSRGWLQLRSPSQIAKLKIQLSGTKGDLWRSTSGYKAPPTGPPPLRQG